jgi:hypothetical protein
MARQMALFAIDHFESAPLLNEIIIRMVIEGYFGE